MEGTVDSRGDLVSDPDSWHNGSVVFNETAANASSVYTGMLSPAVNTAVNVILILSLTVTMVALGCTMELSKIKHHILKPKGVAIALLAQYGVMPLTAFCLAKAFRLTDIAFLVVLISGCSPGGSLSNVLALALQGDMNLSIVMTSCSMLLALGMMPLLLYIYCHNMPGLQKHVPYLDIVKTLLFILVPCAIGILFNHYRPQNAKVFKRISLSVMMTAVVAILVLVSVGIGDSILTVLSPAFTAICALMPFTGFAFGYTISSLFGLNQAERRTVAMETGCQNNQLCLVVLKLAFAPALIGPLFLFPAVYLAFQVMEAAVLMVLLRCYQRFTLKEKATYTPANTEDGGAP